MKYNLTLTPETKLERAVARWLRSEARDRNGDVEGVFKDLSYGGCASGMVGELIYTADAAKFYRRHVDDIDTIVRDLCSDGWRPENMSGWDDSDLFARTPGNQNMLAWLGFEEAARALATRAGSDA